MDRLLVKLPWPPAKTSPNASRQGDFYGKANAAKKYKSTCIKECDAQAVRKLDVEGDVQVRVTYSPPSRRRIDWDNMANRAKQGFDAIAEATGIDDGRWWPVISEKGPVSENGAILVEIYF